MLALRVGGGGAAARCGGDEAEQQQKDDSPAESDDEPDAPQPERPRDARTGRFGPARDTSGPRIRSCSAAAIEWGRESPVRVRIPKVWAER